MRTTVLPWLTSLTLLAACSTTEFGTQEQATDPSPTVVLLEAEAFEDPGGWLLDQQFMDLMGSPYLLAHGMGTPVADARTTAEFPVGGEYRVWVRTRDWVAPWGAPGAPGRFELHVDGEPLETLFGTVGAEWHWQDGGSFRSRKGLRSPCTT